jgi:hypothetical protein
MTFFLSHNLYGARPRTHMDAHHSQPGWLFLELGGWTLEIEHPFYRRRPTPP